MMEMIGWQQGDVEILGAEIQSLRGGKKELMLRISLKKEEAEGKGMVWGSDVMTDRQRRGAKKCKTRRVEKLRW